MPAADQNKPKVGVSNAEDMKSTLGHLGLAEFGTWIARHTEGIFVGGRPWQVLSGP